MIQVPKQLQCHGRSSSLKSQHVNGFFIFIFHRRSGLVRALGSNNDKKP